MAEVKHHRWQVKPEDFAVRIDLPDAPGFFKDSVVVEAGTRALVIDDGQYQGEIPPGEHTMQTFIEKLKVWKRKQATIVLTRLEDQILEIVVPQVRTEENLLVDVTTRMTVKIDDVEDFFNNMMGAYPAISMETMKGFVEPLLSQAVWEAVRSHSIEELSGAAASQAITDGISEQLKLRLLRYGINFINVQLVTIYHEKYNEHQQKEAEVWLKREGVQQQGRLDEVYSENELRKIKQHERQNELRILAKNVDTEYYDQSTGQAEKKVEAMARRIEVRNNLRETMLSDKMNAVNTKEDLAKLIEEVDKDKLIRQEEKDVLLAEYEQRKENREEARDHLLTLLTMNREQEVDELGRAIDHAKNMQGLDHDIELANKIDTKWNRDWASKAEQERQIASDKHSERTEAQAREYAILKEKLGQDQNLEWEGLLNENRVADLKGEMALATAERNNKIDVLEDELKTRQAESDLNRERYAKEQEIELDRLGTESQLDKLARIKQMKLDNKERELRLLAEVETLREDKASQRNIDRINAMKGMSTEELLATAGTENAEILAGVKNNDALTNERQAMNERFLAQEKEKQDAITAALKDAMTTQQTVLNAVVGKDAPTATAAATPPPPTAAAKDWHVSVDGKKHGPYSFTELQTQVNEGLLTSVTTVWKSGFDGWQPASQVSELSELFASSPPPPEPPPPPPPVA